VRHLNSTLPALLAGFTLAALPFGLSVAQPQAPAVAAPQAAAVPRRSVKATQRTRVEVPIDRFTAVTTAITPRDVTLRMNLLRWSDDAGRADVVAALGEPDPTAALLQLPTLGHIWLSSSPVGFAVKYAHRTAMPDGGERITFVSEKRLDYYDFRKWAPTPPLAARDTGYAVVELYLDANGHGTGSFSLAADVEVDEADSQVSLAEGAPRLLMNAHFEPRPYWERESAGASR
jgi:hypothetical protein